MAGLSLSLLALVGAATWWLTRPEPYVAPRPEAPGAEASPAAATEALDALVGAIDDRDPEAAAGLAAPDDARAERQLTALAGNAGPLRLEDLTFRYVDEASGTTAEGVWTAAVDATWAFGGFDEAPARSEVLVTFQLVDAGDGEDPDARIVAVGGGDRRTPLWMTGPVTVLRSPRTLVVAAPTTSRPARLQRVAEAAVPVVTAVLPGWSRRLVVEVPADVRALERALDVEEGTYDAVAAVTSTPDGSLAPDAPVHVFVNPDVFGGLDRLGAQVVMSHEAVHVATDAPASLTPAWLLEGIADYVALRDVRLPVTTKAAQILREVRRQGVPDALPTAEDFAGGDTHLGAAYEAAWLACVVLAEQAGERALVRLYDATRAGAPLAPALRRLTGLTERGLVAAWQDRLASLGGAA